ncbi:hypothetical protein XaFJ1_GM000939 [Xanthomonas albilineans]|nr:hypothetical protein XaFJ1_GM000939 [Xanthomonas albilineans]
MVPGLDTEVDTDKLFIRLLSLQSRCDIASTFVCMPTWKGMVSLSRGFPLDERTCPQPEEIESVTLMATTSRLQFCTLYNTVEGCCASAAVAALVIITNRAHSTILRIFKSVAIMLLQKIVSKI